MDVASYAGFPQTHKTPRRFVCLRKVCVGGYHGWLYSEWSLFKAAISLLWSLLLVPIALFLYKPTVYSAHKKQSKEAETNVVLTTRINPHILWRHHDGSL